MIYKRDNVFQVEETNSQMGQDFQQGLLLRLATGIVIKEHRLRYQKEQYDRFFASRHLASFNNDSILMKDYATEYARTINTLISSSHMGKCPKIEANYDSFNEARIKPLNATIFYYFFGSTQAGRSWAQWILAGARYPNEKVRRAYMRFFA